LSPPKRRFLRRASGFSRLSAVKLRRASDLRQSPRAATLRTHRRRRIVRKKGGRVFYLRLRLRPPFFAILLRLKSAIYTAALMLPKVGDACFITAGCCKLKFAGLQP